MVRFKLLHILLYIHYFSSILLSCWTRTSDMRLLFSITIRTFLSHTQNLLIVASSPWNESYYIYVTTWAYANWFLMESGIVWFRSSHTKQNGFYARWVILTREKNRSFFFLSIVGRVAYTTRNPMGEKTMKFICEWSQDWIRRLHCNRNISGRDVWNMKQNTIFSESRWLLSGSFLI